MIRSLIHISNAGGHRPNYRDLFVRLLGGTPSTGPICGCRFWRLVRAPKLFLATIDDDYLGFFAVALLRAVQRKSTAGLFLRPLQCFRSERPIVYRMKRLAFRWVCKLPHLRLLSIIPHDIYPELAEVSHDWIYDPQMWDLWVDGPPILPDTDLSKYVEVQRQGREILIFVGRGSRIKGFPEFVEYVKNNTSRMICIVAGQVDSKNRKYIADLHEAGAIIQDRFVSDEEILSLYKIADYAWCRYAVDYDQASGIFGRALQAGVKPIVRAGSILDAQIIELGYDYAHSKKVEIARDLSLDRINKV